MNRVSYFEIQVDDLERASKFYGDIFGWRIEKLGDNNMNYLHIITADKDSKEQGINGGMLKRPAKTPDKEQGTNAYVCTIDVENFDETAKKIISAGGIVAMPKFAIPKMAWQGYFLDTEGNTFGIHQPDPEAE